MSCGKCTKLFSTWCSVWRANHLSDITSIKCNMMPTSARNAACHSHVLKPSIRSFELTRPIPQKLRLVLCNTHDTSILIVDTYATIPVSPRSRYTAVYRSSIKYRETAQVSRVSSIPATYCIMSTCVRPILHETILPLCYSVLIFFAISVQ